MLEEYISGGYFVTQPVPQLFGDLSPNQWLRKTYGITEDLLPDKIVSIGFCGVRHAPLFDYIGSNEEYALFGIAHNREAEVSAWASERFNTTVHYPNIFLELATAREYVQRFTDNRPEILIVGIGLHKENLPLLYELEALRPRIQREGYSPEAGFADTGFAQAIKRDKPCLTGEILGFDVVCCRYNIDHSWLCNGLAVDGLNKFNFRPNQYGLIDDKANADKLARYADEIQPEPGVWLPVLVTRYPITP